MHKPVLLKEVLEHLNPQSNQNFIDCTLGDGGHTAVILEKTGPNGKLLGIDLDPIAIEAAKLKIDRLMTVEGNFKNLKKIVSENKFGPVHGILLDLGFRSEQIEDSPSPNGFGVTSGKGLSFKKHEILDMRFGPGVGNLTAKEIVNAWPQNDLAGIFKTYGEEKNALGIAQEIIRARKEKLIIYSDELAEIILRFYRRKLGTKKEIPWIGGLHPATKVFQALRIAVNDELNNLKSVLPQAEEILAPGGRLAVISFHSLEDRIVKHFLKSSKKLKIINKKPIAPSEEETKFNPRSRSAKMRVAEKL